MARISILATGLGALGASIMVVSCGPSAERPKIDDESFAGRFVTVGDQDRVGEIVTRRRMADGVFRAEILIAHDLDLSSAPPTAVAATGMQMEVQCTGQSFRFVRQRQYRLSGEVLTETALRNDYGQDPRYAPLIADLCRMEPSVVLEFDSLAEFMAGAEAEAREAPRAGSPGSVRPSQG